MKPAIVLVGHGSRTQGFDKALKQVARQLKKSGDYSRVVTAYLEITEPDIAQAIESVIVGGSKDVRVLPYFVLAGTHIKKHIPEIVAAQKKKWKDAAQIRLCPYLGYHDKLVSIVKERIHEV
jgi:sirohydrochlorin ferrochelatase